MQKHERESGGAPRPKASKGSSRPQPYRAKKADSLLNIRVVGPDGQYVSPVVLLLMIFAGHGGGLQLFDEAAVAWSSVAGFCARVLGRWGVTGGYIAFETDDGYKLVRVFRALYRHCLLPRGFTMS
jgi:hypothetical protein